MAEDKFPHFTVSSRQQLEADGEPISGAKLCVLYMAQTCYVMPPESATAAAEFTYQFGLNPKVERLSLPKGGSWIFFAATFFAGGSGSLERLAILRYDANSKRIVNLLPYAAVTNAGSRVMWIVPEYSEEPMLVTADFIWAMGEAHYSKHFYRIELWKFDNRISQYRKAFSYRTSKRYESGSSDLHILQDEKQEILRRLKVQQAKL